MWSWSPDPPTHCHHGRKRCQRDVGEYRAQTLGRRGYCKHWPGRPPASCSPCHGSLRDSTGPGIPSARAAPGLGRQPLTQQIRQYWAPSLQLGRFYHRPSKGLPRSRGHLSPPGHKKYSRVDAGCPAERTVEPLGLYLMPTQGWPCSDPVQFLPLVCGLLAAGPT